MPQTGRVVVVGAGMSGAACADAVRAAGCAVTVVERGRAPGGRMAAPVVHGRRVDLGAGYLTVKDPAFGEVVQDWARRGVARKWTDTFAAFGPDGRSTSSGPMRWAAPNGLRSLVRDLLTGVDVRLDTEVTDLATLDASCAAVVLAMPDPQAARFGAVPPAAVDFEPVISVAVGFAERCWPFEHAAFVNDDADVTFVADDGARRGDGAPVLVAHSTAARARQHLPDPDAATGPVLAALRRLGIVSAATEPVWTHAHRWTFAKPAGTHGDARFELDDLGGRLLGRCGDAWCPSGAPRIEAAWLSGSRLGAEVARRLAGRLAG